MSNLQQAGEEGRGCGQPKTVTPLYRNRVIISYLDININGRNLRLS